MLALLQFEEFVAGTNLGGNGDRHLGTLLGYLDGSVIVVDLIGSDVDDTCGGTSNQHLFAYHEGGGLDGKLRHAEFGEIFHALADIHFPFRGVGTIVLVPLAHELPLVVPSQKPRLKTVARRRSHSSFFSSVKVLSSTACIASL